MRQIIDCILYDTEKAQKILHADGYILYKGENKYFLFIEHGKQQIRPIDIKEALNIASTQLSLDEILKHFQHIIEEA